MRTPLEIEHFGPVCNALNSLGHTCRFVAEKPPRGQKEDTTSYEKKLKTFYEAIIEPL